MSNKQRITFFIWLGIILLFWLWVIYNDKSLNINKIAAFLSRFQNYIIIAYLIFSCLRAFTLIPNVTAVLVGTLIIHNPWVLLITSLIGLIVSSSLIYFFGEDTGLDKILMKKSPGKINKIKQGLERFGDPIVFAWGFLPIVPSDLLSFVLGITRYSYWKFVLYYTISHIVTYSVIIFLGKDLWTLLLPGLSS